MSDPFRQLASFLVRAERFLDRHRASAATHVAVPDWTAASAFRWRTGRGRVICSPSLVCRPSGSAISAISTRRKRASTPTRASSSPASRPTTCCSPAPAAGQVVADQGAAQRLRATGPARDRSREGRPDRPAGYRRTDRRTSPERFIIFCDDLSFDSGDARYKALKVVLDGSIAAPPDNVLIYATSNRRHLMPEYFAENLEASGSARRFIPASDRGEDLALRALRPVDFVLPVRPGRLPRHRCALAAVLRLRQRRDRSRRT
jgi:hypothetical protein